MNDPDAGPFQRQAESLLAHPREDLDVEIKGWLDMSDGIASADLGKALLALANHGGGFVLIGLQESDGQWEEAAGRPSELGVYSQDAINSIVARYAEPPFQCSLMLIERPGAELKYPVVRVPSGVEVPVRSKGDDPERRHIVSDRY